MIHGAKVIFYAAAWLLVAVAVLAIAGLGAIGLVYVLTVAVR